MPSLSGGKNKNRFRVFFFFLQISFDPLILVNNNLTEDYTISYVRRLRKTECTPLADSGLEDPTVKDVTLLIN